MVKAFGVKSRFVHFEFFRLQRDQEGLGKAGDLVALEVNMRPSGGFTPDMINFAHSTDVYKIWADMIAFDETTMPAGASAYCAFVGRRDGKDYVLDDAALSGKIFQTDLHERSYAGRTFRSHGKSYVHCYIFHRKTDGSIL